jgi:hypothetical protein
VIGAALARVTTWLDDIGESDMSTEILYHGTNGDNILAILKTGEMTPKGGEIFFGRYRWASLFMHGGDRKRRANFVIKVRAEIPDTAVREYIATQGVGDTLRVRTTQPTARARS